MRLALAHNRLDLRGGTERDLYRTAEGLRDLGHEVHLFCCEFGVPTPAGVIAHSLPILGMGRTARLVSLAYFGAKTISRFDCDVVIGFGRLLHQDVLRCGGGSHLGFLRRMGQSGGARRRLWQKISCYHRTLLALERREFSPGHFKKIIAVSTEVKRDLMENYSIPKDRIAVLYNGVDAERFHPKKREVSGPMIRNQFAIPVAAPLALFVGSGFQRKGLDRLLAIWSSPKLHDAYLLVVGDDARLPRYKAWGESAGSGRIRFAGRQQDIEHYYAAADVVVLPSVQEAFGNVVLEALASGLPVLVSGAAGAAEVLCGALARGIVDNCEDASELVEKLEAMFQFSRDPQYRAEARKLGEQFSWPRHFEKLDALLKEVAR
jgi:UDP-glucose:(heptosyl)LPS alpha-1,3-glucosyltransferase